jgi:hypothetical protein
MAADRRRRLADDTRRVRAEVPDPVPASLTVWRAWADSLDAWADRDR